MDPKSKSGIVKNVYLLCVNRSINSSILLAGVFRHFRDPGDKKLLF